MNYNCNSLMKSWSLLYLFLMREKLVDHILSTTQESIGFMAPHDEFVVAARGSGISEGAECLLVVIFILAVFSCVPTAVFRYSSEILLLSFMCFVSR